MSIWPLPVRHILGVRNFKNLKGLVWLINLHTNKLNYNCKFTIYDEKPGSDRHAIGSSKITMRKQSKKL